MPQIGEIVFDSGDWAEPVKEITVTEKNINLITRFWNSLYFRNRVAAERKNAVARETYNKHYAQYMV